MDRLKDIQWNPVAFDLLTIQQDQKDLIYALINQHNKRKTFDDIITGKGKGVALGVEKL